MKKLILILMALSFCYCNSGTETKEEIFKDSIKQPINFLNREIYLPKDYEKVNLNELGEMLRQNPDLNEIDRFYYETAVRMQQDDIAPELFTQVSNKTNIIWFLQGTYLVLDKEMATLYVDMLERSQIAAMEAKGITMNRLENKFISLKNTKAIKVKYEQSYGFNKKYLTQYIVTYKFDTFSILISHDENEDFQDVLSNFSTY